jgi:voltage-gated potassium channel
MARVNLVERRFAAFLREPVSVRKAMAVIVTATVVSVVAGGVLITLVDGQDFPDVGIGLWWAVQTVTTVGYGDVTPHTVVGRVIGTVIMLESIAFIAIVTAAITSTFVQRAQQERAIGAGSVTPLDEVTQLTGQLAEITARLEQIQQVLEPPASSGGRHA